MNLVPIESCLIDLFSSQNNLLCLPAIGVQQSRNANRFVKVKDRKKTVKPKLEPLNRIGSYVESLASKGYNYYYFFFYYHLLMCITFFRYLRSQLPYEPPTNYEQIVKTIGTSHKLNEPTDGFKSLEQKFNVLSTCAKQLNHSVPNYQLHEMETLGDVLTFYGTPVITTLPLDAIQQNPDLPKNLHIQNEYIRFNSETDTRFGGQTAFPKSSTIVTGLKYRNKYRGNVAKRSWP